MLKLTRRIGETIRIGDDISITVAQVTGNQVRLGIQAPRNVVVDRSDHDALLSGGIDKLH